MAEKFQSRKGTILSALTNFIFLSLIVFAFQSKGLTRDNAFKKGESLVHILLMLKANSTYGLEDVMSDSPPCTDMQRSKSRFDRQVMESDYYGSTLLDQWKEHTPVHLSLLLTNYRGDILWSSSFRVQDKNSSMVHTWFKSENIVQLDDFNDSPEPSDTLATNIEIPGFSAVLQHQSYNNTAYLGLVQRRDNATHCSKVPSFFYFSDSSSSTFQIRQEQNTDFQYVGCYDPGYLADYVYDKPRDLSQCHAVCSGAGYRYFGFLQNNNTCYYIPDPKLVPSSGATYDNCTLIAGYIMSGHRTVNVPLTQTEIVVKSTTVTAGNKTKVYFGNETGFVTAIHVYNHTETKPINGPCRYRLSYSKVDCDTEKYHKISGNKTYDCGVKEYLQRGVQKMKCLVLDLPDLAFADIDIYGIEEPYIAAPALIVMGHYDHNPVEDDVNTTSINTIGMMVAPTSVLTVTPASTLIRETVWTTSTILTTATVTEIISTAVPVPIVPSYSTTPETLPTVARSEKSTKDCCFCDCSMYTAYYKWQNKDQSKSNDSSVASVTNELKANTTVNKMALSSYTRSKNCASDPRPAVRYVGTCGAILLVTVLVCIILIDVSSLRSHIVTIRRDIHGQ